MEDARYVFDEMQRRGVCPGVVTFGTLIHQLCLNFRLEEEKKIRKKQWLFKGFPLNRRGNFPILLLFWAECFYLVVADFFLHAVFL